MSYFNDFAAGYQMTSGKRERDRDRADKIDQERLRKEFEIDRDTARYKAEQDRQGERISADAKRQFNQNFFSAGEADAGRRYGTTEREAGQTYQSGEGEKGRTFTANQADLARTLQDDIVNRQLNQAATQFKATNDRQTAADLTRQGLLAQAQWMKDNPSSLANQKLGEEVTKLRTENANAGPLPGGKPMPNEYPILTPTEAKAAKPGTRYRTQDGRQMIR
jgi:hypothetical protein